MKKLIPVLAMIMLVPFVICSCFVQQAKSMKLSYEEIEFHMGDTKHISVTIEPEGADAGKISWSSSDNKIVTVDDGTITGKSRGTAVVTAESESGLKKLCNVTVLDKEIESVTLSESSTSVKQGGKIQLEAKVKPVDAPSDNLVWSSSDPKVASVDGNGMVLGESEGVVTITCESANGKKATCTVTVKDNNMNATESYTKSTEPTKSDDAKRHEGSNSSSSKSDESRNNGFIFPHSSQRKLTVDEVTGLGGDVAQDAINEIYARHGYVFKTKSIQKYYESRSWYHKNYNFSESDLSEIESYNIGLLRKYN